MAKTMTLAFIAVIILVYILALLIENLSITNTLYAGLFGLLLWLGFISTTLLNAVLWEGKSFRLYLIGASHYAAAFFVAGIVYSLF